MMTQLINQLEADHIRVLGMLRDARIEAVNARTRAVFTGVIAGGLGLLVGMVSTAVLFAAGGV